MKEAKIVLDEAYEEYAGTYVIVRVSFGRMVEIQAKQTVMTPQGQIVKINVDQINADKIMAALKSQPMDADGKPVITREKLLDKTENGVPFGIVDLLTNCINKHSFLSEDDRKKSLTPPTAEQ